MSIVTRIRVQLLQQLNTDSGHDGHCLRRDRKSTRLNSSHRCISYAVFCLKKKKTNSITTTLQNRTGANNVEPESHRAKTELSQDRPQIEMLQGVKTEVPAATRSNKDQSPT